MPNGFESFAQNAILLGQRWRENRKERRVAEALSNIDVDPQGAVAGVIKADPVLGWNMRRQLESDATAAEEAKRAKFTETLKTVTGLLRPAALDPNKSPESLGAAFDSILPVLSTGLEMSPDEMAKWKQMFITNPGILDTLDNELRIVPPGGALTQGGREVYRNPLGPKIMSVGSDAVGRKVIAIDPNTGQLIDVDGGGAAPVGGATPSGATPVDLAWDFTSKHEGGYAPQDANGKPVNFGINQGANPDIDVKNLTKDQAKQLFQERYFNPSGAANLPPALGVLHADTYYMNPKRAQEFLGASGGDPQKYLQMRQAWQDSLIQKNPQKFGKYRKAWGSRNAALAQVVGGGGGAQPTSERGVIFSTPPKASTPGGGFSVLTREEVSALGLNPNVRWQRSDKGEIKPIGGLAQLNPANIAKMEKKDQIYQSISANMSRMENVANRLANNARGSERAAGVMSYFPSIHGGVAANFEADLNALKSQIGFAILNDMRQMSPTGGALGNVSNFEVETLQRNIASLDLSQGPEQLRQRLKEIAKYASDLRKRYERAYNLDKSALLGDQANTGQTGGRAPPKEAIDMLRANPSPQRRQQFDQIFGQGAAKRVLGGQ